MNSLESPAVEDRSQSFKVGDLIVDPAAGQISRDGVAVKLEPKVMEVLSYLASRQGELITRENLERDVWKGAVISYDSITTAVLKLRKALADDARQPKYIVTVPKRGYRLIAVVKSLDVGDEDELTRESADLISGSKAAHANMSRLLLSAAFLLLVLGVALFFYQDKQAQDGRVLDSSPPSIIVLPFSNLSGDATQEHLADGMTDDIITDLSRLSNLLVFSGSTSFTYKERKVQPQEIGVELSVDYVLDGSIRRNGDEIRINVQLADTKTGLQKWASRYDRSLVELFAVQDEVTASIVKALAVQQTGQEKRRLETPNTDNLKAYEVFQEGQKLSRTGSKETNEQAQAAYRQVIRLDPGYGRAYGALAYNLAYSYLRGWSDSPVATLDRALELAKNGIVLNDSIPQTYWSLGYVYLMRKEYVYAQKAVAQAINIAPNYADGYGLLALINNSLGEPEQAIQFAIKGMQLNPYYTWDYPYNLGRASYTLGRYDDAIASLSSALERNENAVPVRLFLAASYVHVDRQDDAEWEIEQVKLLTPSATISHTKNTIPIQIPEQMESFLADLRLAGMPE
ncbi:MAG: hypothetical protein C0631_13435 [Sedimenticola sp.]|nr:MAG: hypothetical protein C0631_13435 [Sedimenticola sp.]